MAGLYIHIPFCQSRCIYCDFFSTTCTHRMEAYVGAVTRELELRRHYLPHTGARPLLHTVYIGGGTPSLLPTPLLYRLFEGIARWYDIAPQAEVTIEANPDDVHDPWIATLHHTPVNRVSLGIQSFDDPTLRLLNRRHNAQQAIGAVRRLQEAGIADISIDLMYGLPGQTAEQWKADLHTALALAPTHLSAYALIYEEHTRLWTMRQRGEVAEADEQLSLHMYSLLMDTLAQAGYEHYEISNFALPGHRARHNSSYWQGVPYIGCGAAAHSYDGSNRQWNCSDLEEYIGGVMGCTSQQAAAHGTWVTHERLTDDERYNDLIITALRTADGLDVAALRQRFGQARASYCLKAARPHIEAGRLTLTDGKEQPASGLLRLTRQGLFLSDGVMSDLLYVED